MAILVSILLVFLVSYVVRYCKYKDGIAILGYHNVLADETKETYFNKNIYVMKESVFEKQMRYLYEHQYHTLSMEELYSYYEEGKPIPKKSVVLTFDDGLESFNSVVKPILEKYDFHATCFVIGRKTTLPLNEDPTKYTYLNKEQLSNDKSVAYYSHTYNMHHKAENNKKQVEVESYESIQADFLKNEGIVDDTYFAFPYGKSSANAKQVLQERSTKLAFGYGQNRKMLRDDDPYLLPRYIMYDFMPQFVFQWIVN